MEDWVKDLAFEALCAVSERRLAYFDKEFVSLRGGTLDDLGVQLDLYPAAFAAPPPSAKNGFYWVHYHDLSGWLLRCALFDRNGQRTDLELVLSVYGTEDRYRVEVEDLLVP